MKKLLSVLLALIIVTAAVPMSHASFDWETTLDIPGISSVEPFTDVYGVTQTWITVDAASTVVTLLIDAYASELGATCWSVYELDGIYYIGDGPDPVCNGERATDEYGDEYLKAGAQYIIDVPGIYVFDCVSASDCVFLELTGNGSTASGNTENTGNTGENGMGFGTPGDDIMFPTDYYGRRLAINMPYYSIESLTTAYRHMYTQEIDHYVVEEGTVVNAPEGTYFTYVDYGRYNGSEFVTDWDQINDTVWTLTGTDISYTLLISDGSFISFYTTNYGVINRDGGSQYNENASSAGVQFMDVTPDAYYSEPVRWAVDNGITVGTSDTSFSPDNQCTRGQILTFLWRAAGCPAHYIGKSPVSDIAVGDYYYDAVLWAYSRGILDAPNGLANPNAPCTRAMTVEFLWLYTGAHYMEDPAPFTDIDNTADYAMAVSWAVANGITQGTSATTFTPDQVCTRGQIVTFLWRTIGK